MALKSSLLSEQTINRLFYLIFSIVSCWLLACAWLIEGEYGDGYATIVNSRFLFADGPHYLSYRGPVAAIILWPVELLLSLTEISKFSVVPYHLYSVVFHGGYLIGCWLLLRRLYGVSSASLLAFVAAILSTVFVAYSPYLSHDILPGLIFLLMILVIHRWLSVQTFGLAMLMIFLGAAVTLFKQTYAIFWISIVFSVFILLLTRKAPELINGRKFAILLLLAGISALISWLGYGFFGQWNFSEQSIWFRPVSIAQFVSNSYSSETVNSNGSWEEIFPWYIYWANIHNYGLTAILMVIPGSYLAFRSQNSKQLMLAISWLFSFIFILLLSAREVRYLGFLAPLTMVLIFPVIQNIIHSKRVIILLFSAVFLFDVSRSLTLGIGYLTNAGSMQMGKFFSPLENVLATDSRLFTTKILNFPFLAKSPFWRDRYHGIYHVSDIHLTGLLGNNLKLQLVRNFKGFNTRNMKVNDVLFFSNDILQRTPPWTKDNQPSGISHYFQIAGVVKDIEIVQVNNGYQIVNPKNTLFLLLNDTENNTGNDALNEMTIITNNHIDQEIAKRYYGEKALQKSFKVAAVVITSLCQGRHCQSLESD